MTFSGAKNLTLQSDVAEEAYFNDDDDEEEEVAVVADTSTPHNLEPSSPRIECVSDNLTADTSDPSFEVGSFQPYRAHLNDVDENDDELFNRSSANKPRDNSPANQPRDNSSPPTPQCDNSISDSAPSRIAFRLNSTTYSVSSSSPSKSPSARIGLNVKMCWGQCRCRLWFGGLRRWRRCMWGFFGFGRWILFLSDDS